MPNELSPEQLEELKSRHIRSFSMRRGHISHAQEKAFEEVFPLYEVPYAEAPLNFEEVFGRKAPVVFEIGCGMGETTAAIAQAHPEVNFLGCEVFVAGVGALSKRIKEMELKNVRIIRHDAVDVIEHMIPPESLDGVHIYFPDPWRKARHHKRRPAFHWETLHENPSGRLYSLRHRLAELCRADAGRAVPRACAPGLEGRGLLPDPGESAL
jgi:tRNA (guanine-N7-)-methyltransferase